MKLQLTFILLLFLAMTAFAGCYTQLGYQEHGWQAHVGSASSDFDRKYHRVLEKEETEDHAEAESEELEPEHTDAEASEGYYGRRKYTRRETYAYPRGYYDTYWGAYAPYPYRYYVPVRFPYYSHPWFYRYGYYGYAPYYRYYPYTNVYRRYYGQSRYVPLSRRAYNKRDLRLENRRSRSSRGVTSPKSKSERPQRRIRNRNER
ncbi:hypothetical protein F4X10_18670 [Candidatus Poribacteria bacterium]|nr:hypothetical protein [Candidatus Poribacteria bacterium]